MPPANHTRIRTVPFFTSQPSLAANFGSTKVMDAPVSSRNLNLGEGAGKESSAGTGTEIERRGWKRAIAHHQFGFQMMDFGCRGARTSGALGMLMTQLATIVTTVLLSKDLPNVTARWREVVGQGVSGVMIVRNRVGQLDVVGGGLSGGLRGLGSCVFVLDTVDMITDQGVETV
ncbi:hypothetical protein AYX14_07064 [Cryptococcus neoformans]|nr:hypothetical protein AYX14_07064 [Cryptococcus neoformans var. grubii]